MKVINDDLSLNTKDFEINNTHYSIRGTKQGKTNRVYDAIDTVKNMNNGAVKQMRRADLNIMLNKFKVKFVQLKNK